MALSPNTQSAETTNILFARSLRSSEQVILPVNDAARSGNPQIPAFYCVHSVSGAAGTDFSDLARRLDSDVRFYGIQAPPKRMEDAVFGGTIEAIADYYVEALLKFQPSGA